MTSRLTSDGAHRHAVGHRDGVELHRRAARGADPGFDPFRQTPVIEIARHGLDPAVPDADQWFGEILAGEADRAQHRPGTGPLVAFGEARAFAFQRGPAVGIRHGFTLLLEVSGF